jgi:hypothetical protein
MLEFGKSISITVARRINRMIFVTHCIKYDMSYPYLIIIVTLPAAMITVMLKKNMSETIAKAANT